MAARSGSTRSGPAALAAAVLVLVVAAGVALGVFSVYEGWLLTHPPVQRVTGNPGLDASLDYRCLPLRLPALCTPEPLFTTEHHVPISAWIVPSFQTTYPEESPTWSTNTVIFVQDHGQSRTPADFPIWPVTRALVDAGYNVVLFDTRGTGRSGGSGIGYGTAEVQDLLSVVQYLENLGAPQGHVAVWGFGTGADAAILAAARTPAISAVIADSPYLSTGEYLTRAIPLWTGLRPFPFADSILWAMQGETGVRYSDYNPRRAVVSLGGLKNPRPLLLVGGTADTLTPEADINRLFEDSHDSRAAPLIVPGAGHLQAFAKSPADAHVPQATEYMCYVLNTLAAMQSPFNSGRPTEGPTGPCGGVSPQVAAEATGPVPGATGAPPAGASGVTTSPSDTAAGLASSTASSSASSEASSSVAPPAAAPAPSAASVSGTSSAG